MVKVKISTANKVKKIAAILSTGRGYKKPKLAGTSSLTNPITNEPGFYPVVHTTDDNNSKQNTDRLAELERRVRDMTASQGAVVGGVDDAEGVQDGAVGLAVGERIDNLESSIKELTTKMSQINTERNFYPGQTENNQKQIKGKLFKYVPLNSTEYTEPTEKFTKFFTLKFEEENKRTVNPHAIENEIVRITGMKPKRIGSFDKTSFTIDARNKTQSSC